MFMVTQILLFIFELFPDAEVCEDVAENFVGGDFAAGDFGKVEEGLANVLGYEVGWDVH